MCWIQVAITYEDENPVEAKGIGRKILAKVQETYQTDLGSKHFAYDGDKTLFTVGPLPNNKLDFSVVLEDMSCTRSNTSTSDANTKRLRPHNQSKRFNVAISFAAKISMQAIQGALQGKETNDLQDAVRVLDVILRQNAATKLVYIFLIFFLSLHLNVFFMVKFIFSCCYLHNCFFLLQRLSSCSSIFLPQ